MSTNRGQFDKAASNLSKEIEGSDDPIEETSPDSAEVEATETAEPVAQAETASETTEVAAPQSTPAAPAKVTKTPEQYEAEIASIQKQGEERNAAYLEQVAKQSPEAWKAVYGFDAPPGTFPAAAPKAGDPAAAPVDPTAKALAELQSWKAEQERQRFVEEIQDKAETHMDRHEAIFTNKAYGPIAQKLYSQAIIANPRGDLAKMADEVAAQFRTVEEGIKAQYINGKKVVAKTVVAGAGRAGGLQPGTRPEKLSFNKRGPGGLAHHLAGKLNEASQSD